MAIFSVTIGGNSYEVYGGLTAATTYLTAAFGPAYTAWLALGADDKSKTLVTATRYLDEQAWSGEATGTVPPDPTTLEWPRSGITDVSELAVPPEVVQAAFELAVLIAADPTLPTKTDQGSNISSVGAGGGVSVSFFSSTSAARGTAPLLPPIVQRLVGRFLAAAGGGTTGESSTGNACSQFNSQNSYNLVRPM